MMRRYDLTEYVVTMTLQDGTEEIRTIVGVRRLLEWAGRNGYILRRMDKLVTTREVDGVEYVSTKMFMNVEGVQTKFNL